MGSHFSLPLHLEIVGNRKAFAKKSKTIRTTKQQQEQQQNNKNKNRNKNICQPHN